MKNKTETAVSTEHQKTIIPNMNPAEKELKSQAEIIVHDTLKVASKYMKLCEHIRSHQIDPASVRIILENAGFAKSRISEVNTIANAANDKWKAITAAEMGWRNALDIARGREMLMIAANALEATPDDVMAAEEGEPKSATATSTETIGPRDIIKKLFIKAANLAEKNTIRSMTLKMNDIGYTVKIARHKNTTGNKHTVSAGDPPDTE